MKYPSIPDRIEMVKKELRINDDVEFGKLCGMTKSVVNQLKTERIKSFAARYAYTLEANSGICAKWMQIGEGSMKLDPDIRQADKIMAEMTPARRKDAVKVIASLAEPKGNGSDRPEQTHATQ